MNIEPLTFSHWPAVEKIYIDGIKTGLATFETTSPGWTKWDHTHLKFCRLVIKANGAVAGWVALSPVSARKAYQGVAEESIYIAKNFRGHGLGSNLLSYLIKDSEKHGIYSLQAVMDPENLATVKLHEKCGFRKIGFKEKTAKLHGEWRDTVLYERRSPLLL